MKVLYLSCHSVLEWDEVLLLSELGHEVFSLHGAYQNGHGDGKRPTLYEHVSKNLHLSDVAIQCSKENIHPEIIEWADVVLSMHNPKIPDNEPEQPWIVNNWYKMKQKRVIWRSIGQSTGAIERELQPYRNEGMQIVRYSPTERNLENYAGVDALIRFYKDENEYNNWNGDKPEIITFAQSMKSRGEFMFSGVWERIAKGFPAKVYGPGNEDMGEFNGGALDYDGQKKLYRDARVMLYTGTYPAAYTLTFIEAMMTGIPIVAIGPGLWNLGHFSDTYEVPQLIQHGQNGFCHNDIKELKSCLQRLLDDKEYARKIGEAGRRTALAHFSKTIIKDQWRAFLEGGKK